MTVVSDAMVDFPGQADVMLMLTALWPEADHNMIRGHARVMCRKHGLPDASALARLKVMNASRAKNAPVDPDTKIEVRGGLYLWPWTADMDRRPKVAIPRYLDPEWRPGGRFYKLTSYGNQWLGSARHGECTPCVKDDLLTEAVYRLADEMNTYSRSSLCAKHARKMLGGPVMVPAFGSPEEAQAWLDAQD